VDLPPGQNLSDFSTAALIDLAKRITHGPHSWSKSNCRKPIAAHRIVLHYTIDQLHGFRRDHVKLLSGGRFVLVFASGVLRCWSVAEDRLVWEYRGLPNVPLIDIYAVEVIEEREAVAIVAGCGRTFDAFNW
jgi:hypothetical protein